MNQRMAYSVLMSVLALFCTFYAIMTLAFSFGEGHFEWFAVFITLLAILTIWTTVQLWRNKDAYWLTTTSMLIVTGLIGWIIIPPGNWDAMFIAIVIGFIVCLVMLLMLLAANVRKALRT